MKFTSNYLRQSMAGAVVVLIAILMVLPGCTKDEDNRNTTLNEISNARFGNNGQGFGVVSPEMVIRWSDASIYVVDHTPQPPPITPFWQSRYFAMVNIAMHDALNQIVPKYQTYALKNSGDKDASPDAAVIQAAYDVIVSQYNTLNPPITTPQEVKDYIDNLLKQSLDQITDQTAKSKGIALGHKAATAVLQKRTGDGSQNITYTFPEGSLPGQYRYTTPFNIPGLPVYGLVDAVGWQNLIPFGLESGAQFRPSAPYGKTDPQESIQTPGYIADYNEIKAIGCLNCPARSIEQTYIGKFWIESPPIGWYKIARAIMVQKNLDAWKSARLLALLQMTETDAYIACADAKMYYYFWRPETAIQTNNMNVVPGTTGDPNWQVLVFPTPPAADYPSGHATAGGAGAELIRSFFGQDQFNFSFTSATADPNNTTRSFSSLGQAARENSLSRIYVGYHFRNSCMVGEEHGIKIGAWVATHSLKEN